MWPRGFGINLVGAIDANVGVGVVARNLARALERHRVPFAIVRAAHDWGGSVPTEEFAGRFAPKEAELAHPINLYTLPLVAFESLFRNVPWLLAPGRMHVASLWWEASALPQSWVENLSRLDAVLAASGFIANIAANGLDRTPVIEAPLPVELPGGIAADRARFGLPEQATVFAASFDPNSDPARKNPLGHIQAFRMAFGPEVAEVRLAIRMNNAATPLGRSTLAAMQRAMAGDARISLILEPLEYAEVLAFFASSDVHLSLHRGEGLGLGILESMALGKPAIATAWSGNASFMGYDCACPVRYAKSRVAGHWHFFQPGFLPARTFWAEPMLEDAAAWMARLHADRALRERLGGEARKAVQAYQARAWSSRWIEELAALWQARAFLPALPGKFSSQPATNVAAEM
jgi:glycosyltransferase involved in cell wall biosynthesis